MECCKQCGWGAVEPLFSAFEPGSPEGFCSASCAEKWRVGHAARNALPWWHPEAPKRRVFSR